MNDEVLNLINARCISLDDEEIKRNNELLKSKIENLLIPEMKNDDLFKAIYRTISFGGSYYDGLKVGRPDEFDLDLKLSLPECDDHIKKRCTKCVQITSFIEKPGYVGFKVKATQNDQLNEFIVDGYMRNDKFLNSWFLGVVDKSLAKIRKRFLKEAELESAVLEYTESNDKVDELPKKKSNSGPAVTLSVNGQFGPIDIDLVPAFEFGIEHWPANFRSNISTRSNGFLIVPKDIEGKNSGKYWRASFQEQEKELIHDKQRLKPALRLLKKVRTSHNELIPSYALKTIVLWDQDDDNPFNTNASLSTYFTYLLEEYVETLRYKKISYFWKEESNLLAEKKGSTLDNYYNKINKMFNRIKKDPLNPYEIAKLILKDGTEEYEKVILEMKENDDKYHINDYDPYGKLVEIYLQNINRKYIKPKYNEYKNNRIFIEKELIPRMRIDQIFNKISDGRVFSDEDYSGGTPTVYLVLTLPKCECCIFRSCNCITVSSQELWYFLIRLEDGYCPFLNDFIRYNYLQADIFVTWLCSLIKQKLVLIPTQFENINVLLTPNGKILLKFTREFGVSHVNVVPAFEVNYSKLPESIRRAPPEADVFMIPSQDSTNHRGYWLPCFHDQEKLLLKERQTLNSAFKLLKKTKDSHHHLEIADYFLKTLFLWDIELNKFDFNKSLGDTFIYFLGKYVESLGKKEIKYYWKKKRSFNLISTCENTDWNKYYEDIKKKVFEFKDDYLEHPELIVKIILGDSTEEYNDFMKDFSSSDDDNDNFSSGRSPPFRDLLGTPGTLERRQQSTLDNSNNEWATAAVAIGAVAVIGLGIWGAISHANRNNNRH